MASHSDSHTTILEERLVLQALCVEDLNLLKTARNLLSGYRWREPVHQVIFACLKSFSAAGHTALHEQLAECTTRKGFPDVEWEDFFPPEPISTREAEKLIRQMRDSTRAGTPGQSGSRGAT